MTTVHHSVAPHFVPHFARRLLLENNWRKALDILTKICVPPLSMEDAISVLKGELTFKDTGEGQQCLVAQDPTCAELAFVQSTENWQKAGILVLDGFFYQPYAHIDGFNDEDEAQVLSQISDEDSMSAEQYRTARAKVYMDDPRSDLVFFNIFTTPILFKRVPDPAFWRQVWTEPKEAVNDFLRHRPNGLTEFGAAIRAISVNSWEFYFNAVKKGVLLYGQHIKFPGLARKENVRLAELVQAQFVSTESIAKKIANGTYDERDIEFYRERFENDARALLYRARIVDQAEKKGGFITLPVKYPVTLMTGGPAVPDVVVPAAPFLLWAQNRFDHGSAQGALPDWTLICPSGLKMLGDSRMHTDWWIGAGLSPREAYDNDHPVNKAAWQFAYAKAATKGKNCLILAGTGKATGIVVKPLPDTYVPAGSIVIVPHAGVEYELALLSACKDGTGVVIAEVGGKLAHLAIVSREMGARLVVMDNALTQFVEGEVVTVNLTDQLIFTHPSKEE
ncbi:MAG: PEP-utilizing enzyme [Agitococcus sp.]|nr:PEP-utilizing enzyme [Agitococcus sp.]